MDTTSRKIFNGYNMHCLFCRLAFSFSVPISSPAPLFYPTYVSLYFSPSSYVWLSPYVLCFSSSCLSHTGSLRLCLSHPQIMSLFGCSSLPLFLSQSLSLFFFFSRTISVSLVLSQMPFSLADPLLTPPPRAWLVASAITDRKFRGADTGYPLRLPARSASRCSRGRCPRFSGAARQRR